ncbi:ImmA/IrrE family metallo-endopeptidase [Haematospirillum sp. 15-248]|uniref:ImmA/IrrE family metallo-endopeptidase n=1 Tax=Haematospirillum sp. 15-248 TaxID=2723107 RepID=UPI0014388633|nr:ImmA/IrrE family metallo-endopeptidase [Haematospirillum sp. 15-248]NKD87726.1 ImmA/IrrE family metallo-endopeptidase [Haematospirillum sp. 15-248]
MNQLASGKAWAIRLTQILNKVPGIERFPVDVRALAQDYSRQCFPDPITMVKGEKLDGFEGALFRSKGAKPMWSIVYNDSLSVPGRINFVLAHEFGHYLRHRQELDEFFCSQRDVTQWDREDAARESDANQFASYLLMPIDDFRKQILGQTIDLDLLGHCADRYGVSLTAATLKWLEFTEQRALLVAAREGFILWAKPSDPALKSGAYIRSKGLVVPVPSGSVAGGAFGDSELRAPVALPAGVWLPNEPVTEMTIVSDRFDMTLSLLLLENAHSGVGLDEDVGEDVFDQIERSQNRGLAR